MASQNVKSQSTSTVPSSTDRAAAAARQPELPPTRPDPLEDDAVFAGAEDLGHFGAVRAGEPTQTLGLSQEETGRGIGTRLHHSASPIGQPQASRGANVAARNRRGRHDAA